MVMLPPLVRDPSPGEQQSSTGRPVAARMVRTQRRYASNYNISYMHEHPKPITKPGFPTPESTFDKWRAAAEQGPHGGGAGDPPDLAARGEAHASGVAATPRRTLHDALLGTTAVLLLGVLGGIGYLVWSGAVPGAAAPGGTAPKGSGIAALVQPLADFAAKAVTRAVPDPAPPPPPAKDIAADTSAPQPASEPMASPPLPVVPDRLALTAPSADKPALAGPPPPAYSPPTVAAEAVPASERAAAGHAASAKPPGPDAAAPAPASPAAVAASGPAPAPELEPEPAAMVAVLPAKPPEPGATPPAAAVAERVAPTVEPATAQAVPPAKPSAPDAAPPVPSIAAVTVRLPPAPEWTAAAAPELASLPEAAAPPTVPAALPAAAAGPMLPAEPLAVPAEMAKVAPPGVDTQQAVSTMALVHQMSLLVHDMHGESLRYRTEVTALTDAVQAKASNLEERLKLAEARSAAGAKADAGAPQAGLPASDLAGDGSGLRVAAMPQVLAGYRVQAGSPGAAVLSDVSAGPERTARLLVMVGDRLPGAGRVTAIAQRGRAWIVRTERGVIQ